MEISHLKRLLQDAAEMGAQAAMMKTGSIKPYMNKSEASRSYGRSNISRWLKEGLLHPLKDGSKTASWRLDRIELESVAKASNRHTY